MIDTNIKKIYAGIGSRETPPDMLQFMETLGDTLGSQGWTCRSGNADGADQAWVRGHLNGMAHDQTGASRVEIFLPWPGFNAKACPKPGPSGRVIVDLGPSQEAVALACEHYPWVYQWPGVKKLVGRNMHQILGKDLKTPVDRVYYWCPKDSRGEPKGGTAYAVKLAIKLGIMCIDLEDAWKNL